MRKCATTASLAIFAALLGPALAQKPADYAYQAPVQLQQKDAAFHRLELPLEVLRGLQRADRSDLRVFDPAGQAVAFAWAGQAQENASAVAREKLDLFPLRQDSSANPSAADDAQLQVRRDASGAVIALRYQSRAPKPGAAGAASLPASYLLQRAKVAAGERKAVTALHLQWQTATGAAGAASSATATVDVEASDDLKTWRSVVSAAPLADLQQGGARLTRRHVELGDPSAAPFLRLRLNGAPWVISEVQAELASATPRPLLSTLEITGKTLSATEAEFDLGAPLPVRRVALKLSTINTVAPIQWLTRDSPDKPWAPQSNTVVYKLARDGKELLSPALEVNASARYWLARSSGPALSHAPLLQVSYAAPQLVLLASGAQAQYLLAFGQAPKLGEVAAVAPALPLASLLPGFKEGDQWKLPLAQVQAAVLSNPKAVQTGPVAALAQVGVKTWTLWAVLLTAVLLLGFLAWRLARKPGV